MLINVNITDITDESGYIEAIGRKAAAIAIQQAKIDVAEQEKKGQIGVAEAEREQAIAVANATKVREIGTREATREQAIRVAQLDKDTAGRRADGAARAGNAHQGIAAAAGDPHRRTRPRPEGRRAAGRVRARSRRSPRPTATSGCGWPTRTPRRSAAKPRPRRTSPRRRPTLAVKKAEAYQLSETKKREAEAAVLEAQNRAMAKAALAEAEKIEAEQRAALEAPAKAEKAQMIVDAEAAAERVKLEAPGRGRDDLRQARSRGPRAVRDPGEEGRGLEEDHRGVRRRAGRVPAADARTHGRAGRGGGEGDLEHQVRQGGGVGGRRRTRTARRTPPAFLQNMARMMPPMMQVMKDIGGVEVPEYLAKLTADTPAVSANGTPAAVASELPKIENKKQKT